MPPRSSSPFPRECASSIADGSHRTTRTRPRSARPRVVRGDGRGHPERAQRVEGYLHSCSRTDWSPRWRRAILRAPRTATFTLAPAMTQPSVMRRAGAGALVLITLLAPRALVGQSAADRRATPPADRGGARRTASLPDSTRTGATFSFDSTERSNWFYVPIDRKGVTLARMTAEARARVDSLLLSGLSATRLRHGQEHHAPRGHPARHRGGRPARSAPLRARFQQVLSQRVRRAGHFDRVGMARRRPPSLGELHRDRPRRAGGVARLLRRESRQGALGSARGAAHPRRGGGSRARAREDARRQAARRSRSSPTRRSWRSRRATIRRPARSSPKDCGPPT